MKLVFFQMTSATKTVPTEPQLVSRMQVSLRSLRVKYALFGTLPTVAAAHLLLDVCVILLPRLSLRLRCKLTRHNPFKSGIPICSVSCNWANEAENEYPVELVDPRRPGRDSLPTSCPFRWQMPTRDNSRETIAEKTVGGHQPNNILATSPDET